MQNNQAIEETFAEIRAAIDLMPEDKRHKSEKQLDIMELTYRAACSIVDNISKIPPPDKKRIFPSYDRTPLRRFIKLEKKQRTAKLITQSVVTAYQASSCMHIIAARPLLKQYPPGAPSFLI